MKNSRPRCNPSSLRQPPSPRDGIRSVLGLSRAGALCAVRTSASDRLRRISCLWMVLLWAGALAAGPKPPSATEKIYRRCEAACVEVLVNGRHSGSGWFARADGLLVTAAHLFDRRDAVVEVVLSGGNRLACSLVAIDRGHDIAVLKTQAPAGSYPVLAFSSTPLRVGDEILQFGAPLYRAGVLQPGRVAQPDTSFEFYPDKKGYVEVLHVAAMMQAGTSGGPWLDRAGNVVGLQSGVMSLEGTPVGIAFLAPAAPIRALLKTLCDAATPDAGFWVDQLWERNAEFLKKFPADTEGLVVSGVREDGPAAKADLRPGDVVTAADGRRVVRIRELLEVIRSRKAGDQLRLTLLRAGAAEPLQRTLTLDRAEADLARTRSGAPATGSP
jgi:S1-C subfamily serine protease